MNDLTVFKNEEFGKVRVAVIDEEPWFVGKDVARALGYTNTRDALAKHVEEDDRRKAQIATPSGKQNMITINESGMYSLIFGSKLESAKRFKRWVTAEVLPTIRKTGSYETEKRMEDKYALYRNPWGDTSDAVLKYNMAQLNHNIDMISEFYGLEKNQVLHFLYVHISEHYGIPLSSYRAVFQAETGEELSTMKVVCMSPTIFAIAMKATQEVIDRKHIFG